MKNIYKISTILISIFIIISMSSCAKKIEPYADLDFKDKEKIIEENQDDFSIVNKKVVKETEAIIETKEETTETYNIESTEETSIDVDVEESVDEEDVSDLEEEIEKEKENEYYAGLKEEESEDCLEKHLSIKEALETDNFKYGMTPIKWVYIAPHKQLISNNKPNSSQMFSIAKNVTSGDKGCFVPIYTENTRNATDTYEARILCYDDTTRDFLQFKFKNRTLDLVYRDMTIREIYDNHNIEYDETDNGIVILDGKFVNVIYIDDLDKIIGIE